MASKKNYIEKVAFNLRWWESFAVVGTCDSHATDTKVLLFIRLQAICCYVLILKFHSGSTHCLQDHNFSVPLTADLPAARLTLYFK